MGGSSRLRRARYSESINVITRLHGSVLLEALPVGLISLILSSLAIILRKGYLGEDALWFTAAIQHPFAIQMFGIVFGFLIATRVTKAVQRWWEAMDSVCQMYGLWYDALTMLMTSIKNDLQKLNLQCSRDDLSRDEVAWLKERIEQLEEFRSKMIHWFSLMHAVALSTLRHGEMESASMLSCNVRETKSLLHTYKSSCKDKQKEPSSIFEFFGETSAQEQEQLDNMDEKPLGVEQWIIEGLMLAQSEQLLNTPAGLVNKILDSILLGMKEYKRAHRLASVPYPFPLAQMMSVLMHSFILIMPFIVEKFTQAIILTPALSFLIAVSYWGLNAVALELESPFGEDWNDLPLHDLNIALNNRLIEIYKECPSQGTSVQTFSEVMSIDGGRLPKGAPGLLALSDTSLMSSLSCFGAVDLQSAKRNEKAIEKLEKLVATEVPKLAAAPAVTPTVAIEPAMEMPKLSADPAINVSKLAAAPAVAAAVVPSVMPAVDAAGTPAVVPAAPEVTPAVATAATPPVVPAVTAAVATAAAPAVVPAVAPTVAQPSILPASVPVPCITLELQADQLTKLAQLVSDGLTSKKHVLGSSQDLSAQVTVPTLKPSSNPQNSRNGSEEAQNGNEKKPSKNTKKVADMSSSSSDVLRSATSGERQQQQPHTISEHQRSSPKSAPQDGTAIRKQPRQQTQQSAAEHPSPPGRTGQQNAGATQNQHSNVSREQQRSQEHSRRTPSNGPQRNPVARQQDSNNGESQRRQGSNQKTQSPPPQNTSARSRPGQKDSPRTHAYYQSMPARPVQSDWVQWEGGQEHYWDPECPVCNEDLYRQEFLPGTAGYVHRGPSSSGPGWAYQVAAGPPSEYASHVVVPSGAIVSSSSSSQSPRPIGQVISGRPPSQGDRSWPRARPLSTPGYSGDRSELAWVAAYPVGPESYEGYDIA